MRGDCATSDSCLCADGYYAVGLARRLPQAKIYANDIYEGSQRLCAACALANGVADRVSVRGHFTALEMKASRFAVAGLICGCEGAESKIFTEQMRPYFAD